MQLFLFTLLVSLADLHLTQLARKSKCFSFPLVQLSSVRFTWLGGPPLAKDARSRGLVNPFVPFN